MKNYSKYDIKSIGLFVIFYILVLIAGKISASYEGCAILYSPNRIWFIMFFHLLSMIPLYFLIDKIITKSERKEEDVTHKGGNTFRER
jgi:hypothetical protein